ncbi:MAG: TauD/TfdA family dioxygenase [Pseudomonadota bacterium]
MELEPLHNNFGVRVHGVDLTHELDDETIAGIHKAVDDHSLLCFPNQKMTDDAQLAFTRQLGEPEPEHVHFGRTGEVTFFGTVGNVVDKATKKDADHVNTRYQKGNEMWHSDSSFRYVPSYVSILHAYEVPGEGGATLFASMRTAYESLSGEMQDAIDPLHVIHDYVFSRAKTAPVDDNHAASLPPIEHKLVRTNPNNGKKNYYVGSHARSIVGWGGIDSRKLIDELNQSATKPDDIYSHFWSVGETVIWDNRCLLHRGGGYDANRWRRHMRQTRVSGLCNTLDE